jgi:hypothetical protein
MTDRYASWHAEGALQPSGAWHEMKLENALDPAGDGRRA